MVANVDNVELSSEELACFVNLVRVLAEIDGFVTLEESDEMALIAKEVGKDLFWAELERSRRKKVSVANLEEYAGPVGRRGAQELIFVLLEQLADADGVASEEAVILGRIRHFWALED